MLQDSVVITEDLNAVLSKFLAKKKYSKIAVLVDENTNEHCYPSLKDLLPPHQLVEIQSGEQQKQLTTCGYIWQQLTNHAFDRKSLFINLGGGVIGDMGGFCASTYKRGIDFLNIPTTLLSQVDASVGGKLGIDFHGYKNHIGMFKDPQQVIISPKFLASLPYAELRSGFAEVIKHHLIYDAKGWSSLIDTALKDQPWFDVIHHSVYIKSQIVKEDPFESGLRKILNFGHTIGHAIESFYLDIPDQKLLHGEAIAIGMITEAYLSMKKVGLSQIDFETIKNYIIGLFNPKPIAESNFEAISALSLQDKKNEGGIINCTLLSAIGKSEFDIPIAKDDIIQALTMFNDLLTAKSHN